MSRYNDLWLQIVQNEEVLELLVELDIECIHEGVHDDPHGYWAKAQELMVRTSELFEEMVKERES